MDVLNLDIVQCPSEYYVQNAFKDTHRCDRKTSYVTYAILESYVFRVSEIQSFLLLFLKHCQFSLVMYNSAFPSYPCPSHTLLP